MASKNPRSGTAAAALGLALVDKQITALKKDHLPDFPHLLNVLSNTNGKSHYPNENLYTPFAPSELERLQYMTFVSHAERGLARPQGDWQDAYYGQSQSPSSAGAQSNTTTPNPFKDPKRPKMSMADYKAMKVTGVRPSPKPAVDTPPSEANAKPGHSRTTSFKSTGTPMTRGSSLEGPPPPKLNGGLTAGKSVKGDGASRNSQRPAPPSSNPPPPPPAAEKSRPTTTNGISHDPRSLWSKGANKTARPKSELPILRDQPIKHPLPPRPQSPPRRVPETKKQAPEPKPPKRPHEPNAETPPEKRSKIQHTRTPSNPLGIFTRKPETPKATQFPVKPPKSSTPLARPSQQAKPTPTHSSKEERNTTKSDATHLPPLLSPLPADLEDSPLPKSSGHTHTKADHGRNPSSLPPKPKVSEDTIVVKNNSDSSPLSDAPKSSATTSKSSSFSLPRIPSPGMPEMYEEALSTLQQKSANHTNHITVDERHQKARLPGAPGVAQKTVKSKLGHPPKKAHAESKSPIVVERGMRHQIDIPKPGEKATYIIALKYRKQKSQDIRRILNMRPLKSKKFMEYERKLVDGDSRGKPPVDDGSSSEGEPLSKVTKTNTQTAKKRPVEPESRAEPAAKRARPESGDVKSHTPGPSAFKSPARSGPSQKSLLATPKKGDAMKSVAMQRISSSDSHARTPQPSLTSTPASAEKSRLNGDGRSFATSAPSANQAEIDKLQDEERKYNALAVKLKRRMDEVLHIKDPNRANIVLSDKDRRLGAIIGLECVVAFMSSFSAADGHLMLSHVNSNRHKSLNHWSTITGLWNFVDGQCKPIPVLAALCDLVGALYKEKIGRWQIECLGDTKGDQAFVEKMVANSREKNKLWERTIAGRENLKTFGGDEVLGPWTGIKDASIYTIGVLTAFSRREGTGWKKTSVS